MVDPAVIIIFLLGACVAGPSAALWLAERLAPWFVDRSRHIRRFQFRSFSHSWRPDLFGAFTPLQLATVTLACMITLVLALVFVVAGWASGWSAV